ncbi:MAG: LEM-3-like GIY-YIG domain-containing protein, partial [Candidatus Thorarchaeota archaeon]
MSEKKENRFYVYVYLDTRKPGKFVYGEWKFNYLPFYVGKGTGRRVRCHLIEANKTNNVTGLNRYKLRLIRKIREVTGADPEYLIVKDE